MKDTQSAGTSEWNDLLTIAHVWHLSPDMLPRDALERGCLDWLTPQERARRQRFRTDHLRHNYLTTRALCRWALSRYTGVPPQNWQFVAGPQGKPEVAAPGAVSSLRFNLTHTERLVACIVTRAGEVGLDAEEISRPIDISAVAGQFFSPAERDCLSMLPSQVRTTRFYEYWVLKEAYLKARGTGLSQPPESFTIAWQNNGQPAALDDWQLALHRPTPQHVAGIAVPQFRGAAPLGVTWRWADILEGATSG
jgi:4'-phosphopantetheinyl transferase